MKDTDYYVLVVNRTQNISKAAAEIGISQPALSTAITSLENKLGFCIFDRSTYPLSLTNEGKLYIDYLAKKSLLQEQLANNIERIKGSRKNTLSIGAPSVYINSHILPHIKTMANLYPEHKLSIIEGTVSYLSYQCINGRIDCFISTTNDDIKHFDYTFLSSEQLFLCANKSILIPSADNIIENIKCYEEHSFILLGNDQPLRQTINKYLKSESINPQHVIEVDQVSSAVKLAEYGCGICFASSSSLINNNNPDLVTFPLPTEIFERSIYIAISKGKMATLPIDKLVELIKST